MKFSAKVVGGNSKKGQICVFWLLLPSSTNFGYFSRVFNPSLPSKIIVNITGDENGSIWIFLVFGFLAIFLAILAIFGVFGGFVGDWGVLGVLVTYMITRGIKLVVGRFTEGVKGGLREFWGVLVRSRGVLLDPFRTHFVPLEVL